jgi:hypothetical protein
VAPSASQIEIRGSSRPKCSDRNRRPVPRTEPSYSCGE